MHRSPVTLVMVVWVERWQQNLIKMASRKAGREELETMSMFKNSLTKECNSNERGECGEEGFAFLI